MASARDFGFATVCRCVFASVGIVVLVWAGCAGPGNGIVRTGTPLAEIVVINRTAYAWRLAIRTVEGAEVKVARIAPLESREVRVAGGADYVIEQSIVTPGADIPEPRNIAARFEPGERYRWRLETLLMSGDEAERAKGPQ